MAYEPYNVTDEVIDEATARGEFIWSLSSGGEIPVSAMTEEHLRNALRYASRKQKHFAIACDAFRDELRRRREPSGS